MQNVNRKRTIKGRCEWKNIAIGGISIKDKLYIEQLTKLLSSQIE